MAGITNGSTTAYSHLWLLLASSDTGGCSQHTQSSFTASPVHVYMDIIIFVSECAWRCSKRYTLVYRTRSDYALQDSLGVFDPYPYPMSKNEQKIASKLSEIRNWNEKCSKLAQKTLKYSNFPFCKNQTYAGTSQMHTQKAQLMLNTSSYARLDSPWYNHCSGPQSMV